MQERAMNRTTTNIARVDKSLSEPMSPSQSPARPHKAHAIQSGQTLRCVLCYPDTDPTATHAPRYARIPHA